MKINLLISKIQILKDRFFLFSLFVVLSCFAADCLTAQQLHQPEGHWRWRKNPDMYVIFGAPNGLLFNKIPTQDIQNELADHEKILTKNINPGNLDSNIGLAAITLGFQDRNLANTEDVFTTRTEWVTGDFANQNQMAFFPSTAGTNFSQAINHLYLIKDDPAQLLNHFVQMENFWQQNPLPIARPIPLASYNSIIQLIQNYQLNPPNQNTVMRLHHSEQRIMAYLSENIFYFHNNNPMNPRIIAFVDSIIQRGGYGGHNDRLKLIILHIHSTRDPCETCNNSLSLFSHYMNHIIGNNFPGQNIDFRLIVSSRRSHKKSRYQEGGDSSYHKRIIIDLGNIAPMPNSLLNVAGGVERIKKIINQNNRNVVLNNNYPGYALPLTIMSPNFQQQIQQAIANMPAQNTFPANIQLPPIRYFQTIISDEAELQIPYSVLP